MRPSGHWNLSRLRMAMVGTRKEKVPPWMMGRRHPRMTWSRVTRPETNRMVEMMYPRAGSSSLMQRSGHRMKGIETVAPNMVR